MVFGLITKGKICNKRWHPHLENETSFHLLEQSVFPVRHNRASPKVGSAWKRVARVMNPTQAAHLARVTFPCGSRFSRSLACSFCATIGLSGDCSRFYFEIVCKFPVLPLLVEHKLRKTTLSHGTISGLCPNFIATQNDI